MLGKARIIGACMGGVQKVEQNGKELAENSRLGEEWRGRVSGGQGR